MATIQRPTKEGSVRTYQEKVGLGFVDILASEMDADLDTIYAAWNGGVDSVTLANGAVTTPKIGDGQVTYAKLAPDAQLWRDTGTTLTTGPNFTAKPVAITAATTQLTLGSSTITGQLSQGTTGDLYLLTNNSFNPTDAAKSSWNIYLSAVNDRVALIRRAPGAAAGSTSQPFTVDGNGTLTTVQPVGGADSIICQQTPFTIRGHLGLTASPSFAMRLNANLAGTATDAPSLPSWTVQLDSSDTFTVWRAAPTAGAPAFTNMFGISNVGNLNILGPTGTKSTGTTWANPSDRRLKDEIADYATGLAAILALRPRSFVFNGKGGSTAGMRGYGFIADEVAPVMPETVSMRAGKLDADDEEDTEIQMLDQSNLILALVNAVRELAARVTALEAPA